MTRRQLCQRGLMAGLGAAFAPFSVSADATEPVPAPKPLLLAHYMTWFEAPPVSPAWGWHWTMNRFHPGTVTDGRRDIASHYHPLIGPYDSGDPDVLECHALLMKLSGIDGVILDWYGPDDFLDYGVIHRNALKLVPNLKRAGLRFAVCYEDQSVRKMIEAKRVEPGGAVEHGRAVMRWLHDHWFGDPAYVALDGRPLLLVFGPQFYTPEQWRQLFATLPAPPAFFTLHDRREPAVGAFDWPQPAPGRGMSAVDAFYRRAKSWPQFIPAAFPRFHDIYMEAGVGASYGYVADQDGKTFADTLERALSSVAPFVQLVTWNDWGEGTVIEPSVEFGYRDLERVLALRRQHLDHGFRFTAADLRLPVAVLRLRREHEGNAYAQAKLDAAAALLYRGDTAAASKRLASFDHGHEGALLPTRKPGE